MNRRLAFAGIATGVAFTAFGAVPATAASGPIFGEIGIVDEVIRPGQEVTVRAVCTDGEYVSSEIDSPVLTAPPLAREEGALWEDPMTVRAKVDADAEPGTYQLSFLCGETVSGEFTVVAGEQPPTTQPPTTQPVPPQVPVKPKGAADTGSLDTAPQQGPDAGVVALGGMALLAAGGLGIAAHRRRQRT